MASSLLAGSVHPHTTIREGASPRVPVRVWSWSGGSRGVGCLRPSLWCCKAPGAMVRRGLARCDNGGTGAGHSGRAPGNEGGYVPVTWITCCICEVSFWGYGNNPDPVDMRPNARCCDRCNAMRVIPARLAILSDWPERRKGSQP